MIHYFIFSKDLSIYGSYIYGLNQKKVPFKSFLVALLFIEYVEFIEEKSRKKTFNNVNTILYYSSIWYVNCCTCCHGAYIVKIVKTHFNFTCMTWNSLWLKLQQWNKFRVFFRINEFPGFLVSWHEQDQFFSAMQQLQPFEVLFIIISFAHGQIARKTHFKLKVKNLTVFFRYQMRLALISKWPITFS